jgi:hypothetical protein
LLKLVAEWDKLQSFSTPLGANPRKRAANFPFDPDPGTLTDFKRLGFHSYLGRIKQCASVATSVKQLAEFIAWVTQLVDVDMA